MIGKLSASARYLLGRGPAGRNLRTYPDDTFIVSYPKSGNTWGRFLAANLLHDQTPMSFLKADELIPSVDFRPNRYFKSLPRPRVIKSHYPFDQNYKRVIYIVRDPKDVAVSQYHYQIKRKVLQDEHPIDEWVTRFVAGETCPYGSWGENVSSWLAARGESPGFLLIRYEDMIRRTDIELTKIANFLGMNPSPQQIEYAISQSTADRMRKLEQEEAERWDSTKDTRKDKFFVRNAKVGEGRVALSSASIARIDSAWGPLMRWLGYDTPSEVPSAKAPPAKDLSFLETILEQQAR